MNAYSRYMFNTKMLLNGIRLSLTYSDHLLSDDRINFIKTKKTGLEYSMAVLRMNAQIEKTGEYYGNSPI